MANRNTRNIDLFGCIDVRVSGAAMDVSLINCSSAIVEPVSSVTAIGSASSVIESHMSGWVLIKDGRVLPNKWVTIDSTIATALNPYSLDGAAGNKYKIDTSGGHVYIEISAQQLKGVDVNFKIIDATNNVIISTTTNTETLDGNALPYTIPNLVQWENYPISSDGSNFFIL